MSALDSIKGIGEKSRDALLQHFGSLEKIKRAGEDELAAVVGRSKAEVLTCALKEM